MARRATGEPPALPVARRQLKARSLASKSSAEQYCAGAPSGGACQRRRAMALRRARQSRRDAGEACSYPTNRSDVVPAPTSAGPQTSRNVELVPTSNPRPIRTEGNKGNEEQHGGTVIDGPTRRPRSSSVLESAPVCWLFSFFVTFVAFCSRTQAQDDLWGKGRSGRRLAASRRHRERRRPACIFARRAAKTEPATAPGTGAVRSIRHGFSPAHRRECDVPR